MKSIYLLFCLSAAVTAAILAGCSKSGAGSASVLEDSKVPATVTQAFANAPADAKKAAAGAVSAFEGTDPALAFQQLQQMSTLTNLTAPQRQAVARAMQTAFVKLQTAAQNGDSSAQKTMSSYLSTR